MMLTLIWQGREIAVTYIPNWCAGIAQHLELRATRPLPVTETGYRSRFLPAADAMSRDELEQFVHDWLDAAAQDKDWLAAEERSRQGDLFDL